MQLTRSHNSYQIFRWFLPLKKTSGNRTASRRLKRALWIVNHKTLLPAEVPILRSLGYEIFIPKIVPEVADFRSAVVDHSFDPGLELSPPVLQELNDHHFYEQTWSPSITLLLNRYFDVLVTSMTAYTKPLFEAIRKFNGFIVARPFGREHPRSYTEFLEAAPDCGQLMARLEKLGERFVFGQAFDNLASIECELFKRRAYTITVPIPQYIWHHTGTWHGSERTVLFLCPNILDSIYYREAHSLIKTVFGDLPHRIFGRQNVPPQDPAVIPYMTDLELVQLYARTSVFAYPSREPRHVHYSPLEAMVVGTPVLYMKNGLISSLGGDGLPGQCEDIAEMRWKAERMLNGDSQLRNAIRPCQHRILECFSTSRASRQWAELLSVTMREQEGRD
jgi:hypothetical protein